MSQYDRRIIAARADLAASHLRGIVDVDRYVEGTLHRVQAAAAALRPQPDPALSIDTELLYGETFTLYDRTDDGWAWGQSTIDDYVGWLKEDNLSNLVSQPTHIVSVPRTFLYPSAELKKPPVAVLSMMAQVHVTDIVTVRDLDYAIVDDGGAVVARHLRPMGEAANDYVAEAEAFLTVPYLWGGRTSIGIDCSALVQIALAATGVKAPRDSDMQAAGLGESLDIDMPLADLIRGDLLFWPGHVAIAAGDGQMLHASGHHMMVVKEPLIPAVARIAGTGLKINALRRP